MHANQLELAFTVESDKLCVDILQHILYSEYKILHWNINSSFFLYCLTEPKSDTCSIKLSKCLKQNYTMRSKLELT